MKEERYHIALDKYDKGGAILEVKINKEIRNYTESMFFGLSLRQFIFSVLACGVAVGLFFLLRPHFGTETLSWVCILGAFPFAAIPNIAGNFPHQSSRQTMFDNEIPYGHTIMPIKWAGTKKGAINEKI